MDMTELTFTLDEATIRRLDDLAQQLARTKSESCVKHCSSTIVSKNLQAN
jgi:predicted transcriptional regulator